MGKETIKEAIDSSLPSLVKVEHALTNQTKNPPYTCISLFTGLVLKAFNSGRIGLSITKNVHP